MPYPSVAPAGNPYGPEIAFQTENIFPPSAVYVGPDDSIVLLLTVPSVTGTLQLSYRLLTPQGEIQSNHADFPYSPTAPAGNNFLLPPAEGFLLSATLWAPGTFRGQVFARLLLQRGRDPLTPTLAALLCQGYVSNSDRLGYPMSPPENSLSGRGWTRTIQLANPGPGLTYFVRPTPSTAWRLKAFFCNLLPSAVVSNRYGFIVPGIPGAGSQFAFFLTAPMTAGLQWSLSFLENVPIGGILNHTYGPMPADMLFDQGELIQFGVQPMDPGDNLLNATLTVEEWVNF